MRFRVRLRLPANLPHLKRTDEKIQSATLARGRDRPRKWLKILEESLLGTRPFLCGDRITLADYLGSAYLTVGEVIRLDYAPWPNVKRWLDSMRARPHWQPVNEAVYANLVAPYANTTFEAL